MQKDSFESLLQIDTVCTTEVCLRTIAGPDILPGRNGRMSVIHLEVVSREGKYFTTADLKHLCLSRHETHELEDLCVRRFMKIANFYFPNNPPADIKLSPGVRFIDPESNAIRITFFLTRKEPDE